MKTAILRHDICLVQISDKTREGSETLQSDDSVAAIFFYSIILINYNYFHTTGQKIILGRITYEI